MEIKPILEKNYHAIAEIYLQGIATGHATFQTEAPE
jgi:L-amino acid N-acyltransferase YncA